MIKKLLLSIFLFIFLAVNYLLLPSGAYAQGVGQWYNQGFREWYTKVYDTQTSPPSEIFGERYTAAQVQWVFYSIPSIFFNSMASLISNEPEGLLLCIMNLDVSACASFVLSSDPFQNQERFAFGKSHPAAIFFGGGLSGIGYVREKLTKLHIIPEAKAQAEGFGFGALNPIQNIWRAFRDITYAIFVIIIIAMAFMIMFRVKLSPQTVVTVQSALPKIIISLILVTFSYAIAGFMVDLIYVIIGLLSWIVINSNFSSIMGNDWSEVFHNLTYGPGGLGIFSWLFRYWGYFMVGTMEAWWGAHGVFTHYQGWIQTGSMLIGVLVGIIFALISVLLLLWAGLKTIFMLLKTYIVILISVMFAPLQIGLGVLVPGAGFGPWLKNLLANLAVYPTVGILLVIAFTLLSAASPTFSAWINNFLHPGGAVGQSIFQGNVWYPPLTFGLQSAEYDPLPILWLYASFGIMLLIPKAGEMVQSAISGRPFVMGTAIGQALGPVMWVGGQAVSGAQGFGWEKLGYAAHKRSKPKGEPIGGVRGWIYRTVAGAAERRGGIIAEREGGYRRPGEN